MHERSQLVNIPVPGTCSFYLILNPKNIFGNRVDKIYHKTKTELINLYSLLIYIFLLLHIQGGPNNFFFIMTNTILIVEKNVIDQSYVS